MAHVVSRRKTSGVSSPVTIGVRDRSATNSVARPRVLHIITGLGTGGAEASLVRIIAGTRHEIDHAVVSLTSAGTRGNILAGLGVSVYPLELARGSIAPRALKSLLRIAREFRPTCVQGWMYHGNLAASALAVAGVFTGIATGPVLWNVRHALDAWKTESRMRRLIIRGAALLSWQPRSIIYNSHRSAQQHASLGYRSSVAHVVLNGVDASRFAPDADARTRLRASLEIPDSAFVVGLVARVDPLKDHATFFAAIAEDVAADPLNGTYYLLAGTGTAQGSAQSPGELDVRIDALIASHPQLTQRIVRLGERRDVVDVLNACDVISMTSRSEGSPNIVTEAMACALPCVVTDVGDAARIVGDSGIVVPVGDHLAIAHSWQTLRADAEDRKARGQRALSRARAMHSVTQEREAYVCGWLSASSLPAPLRAAVNPTTPNVPQESRLTPAFTATTRPRVLMVTTVSTTLRAFLLPYADHFRSLGWRVDALAAGADTDPVVTARFCSTFNITWARNPLSSGNFASVRRIREIVAGGQYDLVHVHTPVAAFLTRFALRGMSRPVVTYTAHSFHADKSAPAWKNFLFRSLERLAARWTDHLIVLNRADYDLAQRDRLVADERLHWHPGIGVDCDRYRPLGVRERRQTRVALGLRDDDTVLVMVAEFSANKRQRDVVRAFEVLRARGIALPTLLFVGDGPQRPQVEARVRASGLGQHLRFLGFRTDVPALVGASNALMLVSAREGLPRCILEAQAMEIPVIGSDAKGTADLLADGRGLVVGTGNFEALADAIQNILDRPAEARSRAMKAAAWVRETGSLSRIIDLHDTLYHQALGLSSNVSTKRHSGGSASDPMTASVTHAA